MTPIMLSMHWILQRMTLGQLHAPSSLVRHDEEKLACAPLDEKITFKAKDAQPNPLPAVDGTSRGLTQDGGDLRMTIPELYHRLQNLSHYPHALPLARRFLLTMLSDNLASASSSDPHCILSLPSRFTADALASWLTIETERTTARYGDYVKRRKVGGRREMFEDYDDAVRWCRESAVVKYVDGAWLQGTLRSTTGVTSAMEDAAKAGGAEASDEGCARATEAEWRAARVSWQVLSEELGDGDLDRSHVDAFQRLVDAHATDGKQQPRGYELDFLTWLTDDAQDQPNKQPWVAALLQLTVSASPNEFLPEMLGFNLSYEGLPYHLLVTARELRELGIDPYYFVLHISIDNSESGHSAMARLAVEAYLHEAEAVYGPGVADSLWRRIQAGYILADSVRTTPQLFSEPPPSPPPAYTRGIPLSADDMDVSTVDEELTRVSMELLELFKRKAAASRGLHASAMARLGGRSIAEWMTPEVMGDDGETFINALANGTMWVERGQDPEKSKLYREFLYGGRMFGALTRSETITFRKWIELLPAGDGRVDAFPALRRRQFLPTATDLDAWPGESYRRFIYGDRATMSSAPLAPVDLAHLVADVTSWADWQSVATDIHAATVAQPDAQRHLPGVNIHSLLCSLLANPPTPITSASDLPLRYLTLDLAHLEPLYYLSLAPLEHIASASPSRLASPLAMAIIKALRCLYGFSESDLADGLDPGCLGTDDVHVMANGIRELGPALFGATPPTLIELKKKDGETMALPALILALNTRPTLYLPYLLGMAYALNVGLHERLAKQLPASKATERLDELTARSRRWLVEAMELGLRAKEPIVCWDEGEVTWAEGVALGYELAWQGMQSSGSRRSRGL